MELSKDIIVIKGDVENEKKLRNVDGTCFDFFDVFSGISFLG